MLLPPIGNNYRPLCTNFVLSQYKIADSYFWSEGVLVIVVCSVVFSIQLTLVLTYLLLSIEFVSFYTSLLRVIGQLSRGFFVLFMVLLIMVCYFDLLILVMFLPFLMLTGLVMLETGDPRVDMLYLMVVTWSPRVLVSRLLFLALVWSLRISLLLMPQPNWFGLKLFSRN
jgi:hypothetical protein